MGAQAQPIDAPFVPSEGLTREVTTTITAFVAATEGDDGYKTARTLVIGSSADARLARAWREWRRVALTNNTITQDNTTSAHVPSKHLIFRSVEVEELHPARETDDALQAQVKVHLDVATASPNLPAEQWPAEPWQGDFTLQKGSEENAQWQFASVQPDGNPNAFFQFSERGGNWLEQATEVVRYPQTMLRTTRLLTAQSSLRLLVDAIQRYVARTGHYPPSRYFSALLEGETETSRPALRQAFRVAGTTRAWRINPALAGQTPKEERENPQTWLLWDGTARHPYFLMAGYALVAFLDGHIATVSAQDLQ